MQPADLANRALDSLGVSQTIGDLEEGSKPAQVLLRQYGACLRQLLRGANWNWARRRDSLVMLQDATGWTTQQELAQGITQTVGVGTIGMRPWLYEYRWPPDCVKVRFLPQPWQNSRPPAPPGNYAIPAVPLWQGQANIRLSRDVPTRFLIANDSVPNLQGQAPAWNQVADTANNMGQGLTSQTVILCNHRDASAVYTALITYPDQWDPLFQQAFVAMLAERSAMALMRNSKDALRVRDEQIKVAQMAISQARVQDGNESWTSTDLDPDWMRARNVGTRWGAWGEAAGGEGQGVWGYGWDRVSFSNGSAY